jgi:hypothetical protein
MSPLVRATRGVKIKTPVIDWEKLNFAFTDYTIFPINYSHVLVCKHWEKEQKHHTRCSRSQFV